jgi:antitoxin (DNA-binding transcriptional repressor) of toxin-antitoxin stability system
MKRFTVSELRRRFAEAEACLLADEEIEITRRNRVVARLLPPKRRRRPRLPDFAGRLKKIYAGKVLKISGAELIAEGRERF